MHTHDAPRFEHPEQRSGLALHSAGLGVWDLDVIQHRVHCSPQWKAMLGYGDVDEAEPTSVWRERAHPEDRPGMLVALAGHLSGANASYDCEFHLRAGDGRWRWVLSRGRVVRRGPAGEPLRAVGTLTDLSDRREAELMRAQRDRAEAERHAMAELLSRMSHELRTRLKALLGVAQLLGPRLDGAEVGAQRRDLAQIEHAGWQLLALIDEMLQPSDEHARQRAEASMPAMANREAAEFGDEHRHAPALAPLYA